MPPPAVRSGPHLLGSWYGPPTMRRAHQRVNERRDVLHGKAEDHAPGNRHEIRRRCLGADVAVFELWSPHSCTAKLRLNADKAVEEIRTTHDTAHVDRVVGSRDRWCRSAEAPWSPFHGAPGSCTRQRYPTRWRIVAASMRRRRLSLANNATGSNARTAAENTTRLEHETGATLHSRSNYVPVDLRTQCREDNAGRMQFEYAHDHRVRSLRMSSPRTAQIHRVLRGLPRFREDACASCGRGSHIS